MSTPQLLNRATKLCIGLEFPIDTFAVDEAHTILVAHTPEGRGYVQQGRTVFTAGGNLQLGRLTLERRGDVYVLTHLEGGTACVLPPSDLVVEQPTVSKSTLTPGENFTLSVTVKNQEVGSAAATTLRYYRSTDATISTSDTEVATDSVSGLDPEGSDAASITLTAPTSPGTYYYGACIDAVVDESSSDNNCSDAVSITVQQPTLSTSTASPLIETTLDESEVTLTLTAATYEQNVSNISNAVTVSGIDGVTVDKVRRRSDTEIAVDLAFDGTDFDADATLIFTIGADAIANYTGTELTAQVSVTASKESLAASTKSPLTADTLDGSVVTLTLSGRTFSPPFHGLIGNQAVAGIRGVKVSGISGLTIPSTRVPVNIFINGIQQSGTRYGIDRISDTELEVEFAFDGNLDSDATITLTVDAETIEGYNGPALTADISVAAPSSVALRGELALTMFGDIKRTALLQNFPNPFNPETWIPYRLANDSDVLFSIYDINGALVRELDLGHQRAGYYTDRTRAAYMNDLLHIC